MLRNNIITPSSSPPSAERVRVCVRTRVHTPNASARVWHVGGGSGASNTTTDDDGDSVDGEGDDGDESTQETIYHFPISVIGGRGTYMKAHVFVVHNTHIVYSRVYVLSLSLSLSYEKYGMCTHHTTYLYMLHGERNDVQRIAALLSAWRQRAENFRDYARSIRLRPR